jgi:hypothetical protein
MNTERGIGAGADEIAFRTFTQGPDRSKSRDYKQQRAHREYLGFPDPIRTDREEQRLVEIRIRNAGKNQKLPL